MKTLLLILALSTATFAGDVWGRVSPAEGFSSLHRISVHMTGEVDVIALVNPLGYFMFQDIPEGEYLIEAITSRPLEFDPYFDIIQVGKKPVEVNFIFYPYNPCIVSSPC
jgi:hypothetical protein